MYLTIIPIKLELPLCKSYESDLQGNLLALYSCAILFHPALDPPPPFYASYSFSLYGTTPPLCTTTVFHGLGGLHILTGVTPKLGL